MKIILKNFLNTLKSYKASNLLNIIGLALAFASMYILLVQVNWELTYNRSIKDSDRIFAVEAQSGFVEGEYSKNISRATGEKLITLTPYVEIGGVGFSGVSFNDVFIERDNKIEKFTYCATSSISVPALIIFGFETIKGDLKDLSKPKTLAISESKALKYGLNVGDGLYFMEDIKNADKYVVVAIYKDFKDNTDLSNNPMIYNIGKDFIDDASEWSFHYFVKLKSADDKAKVEEVFNKMMPEDEEYVKGYYRLMPLDELYFEENCTSGIHGNQSTVYTLLTVAILIVIIALINFVNFFYALVPIRIKKVNTMK
ncbi:MAG: ABC transporter permease, partial [Rikenellaceae bacterium]